MANQAGTWDKTWQDVRFGWKLLGKDPGFTAMAVLALALGIGATSTVFSVLHSVLLSPLPFHRVDRLVTIWGTDPKRGAAEIEIAWREYEEWRRQNNVLEDVALMSSVNLDMPLTGDGQPQQVESTIVTHTFFRTLGVKAFRGRVFSAEDDRQGAPPRCLIGYSLWQSRYGGSDSILGRQIRSDQDSLEVIGVMPPEFDYPRDVQVWLPAMAVAPNLAKENRDLKVFAAVARLRSGVSLEQAQAEMAIIGKRLDETSSTGKRGLSFALHGMLDAVFGNARQALWIMMGAVALVLLLACLNVGNLLLARGAVREREMAIRAALGAGRGRLFRQLLVESFLLAILGTAAGFGLLYLALKLVAILGPADIPRLNQVELNAISALFTVVLAFAATLVFGAVPALQGASPHLADTLKETSSTSTTSGARLRFRNALVTAEVAVAVMLAVGAGLLVKSFRELQSLDPGFNADNVFTFRLTLNAKHQEQAKRQQFYAAVLDKVRALPGVVSAGAVLIRPLSGTVGWDNPFTVDGQSSDQQAANPNANYEAISPDYFGTMSIPLLAGRDFARGDTEKAQGVIIVNESFAKRHWGVSNAVGRRVKLGRPGGPQPWLTVVGVAKDVRYREWEAVRTDLYIPFTQRAQHRSDFVVKTTGDPTALAGAVRAAVRELDKDQAISNVTTMRALVDAALARAKFNMAMLTIFAACALALASIGVYGVISYFVAQRRTEIGIRMALGATTGGVARLVLGQGIGLVTAGIVGGVVGALALTRWMGSILYGIKATDPGTYATVVAVLLLCGVGACLIPVLRAVRVSPASTLR